jgi:hypothetical protein
VGQRKQAFDHRLHPRWAANRQVRGELTDLVPMTIRIVCENETGYDPTTGTFMYCDHTFTCDDSLLAKVTRCPKCQNSIRVGTSHRHVWADSGKPVADPNTVKQHARKLAAVKGAGAAAEVAGRGGSSPSPTGKAGSANGSKNDATPGRPGKLGDANPRRPTAAVNAAANPNGSGARGKPGDKASAGDGKPRRTIPIKCYNCGTVLQEIQAKCPACLADLNQPLGLGSGTLVVKSPVGFHRWLFATAFAGVKPTPLFYGFHALFLTLLLVSYGLLLMLLPIEARVGISIAYGVLAVLYLYVTYACYRACTNLGYRLRWWQRFFWLRILSFARRRQWSYDPTEEGNRLVLDLREKNINDLTLVQVENLTQCEVLDIAGCPVTDRGTKALHYLRNLRCLVLVGTGVSQDEVGRLQKSLPNCWIWH